MIVGLQLVESSNDLVGANATASSELEPYNMNSRSFAAHFLR